MTKTILFSIFILLYTYSVAQTADAKRDNIWLFGYGSNYHITNPNYGNMMIDFSEKPTEAIFKFTEMNFNDDAAMICDTAGKLLFYTNGIYIADKTHQAMKNGLGLNPGKLANDNNDFGYICSQGSVILPKPESKDLFYLIHSSIFLDSSDGSYKGDKLYYTLVDMKENGGKGAVVKKNVVLADYHLDYGKITACRHANGKDWWITVASFDTKYLNTYLLNKDTLVFKHQQVFSKGILGGAGQAVFSPDGTKYARYNVKLITEKGEMLLYDFDRCSGKFSNQKQWLAPDSIVNGGVAFSPNSRYLYIITGGVIFQMDTEASDLSVDTVAIYDGFKPPEFPTSTSFRYAQLAPDNKIYICTPGTTRYMHIIHDPDKKGKACHVEQHGLVLKGYNYTTMPNFPNFRLGAAATPCSTSSEDVATAGAKVSLYPNPASDHLTLDIKDLNATQLEIYDLNGKAIAQQSITTALTDININALPNGLYYCRIYKDKSILTQKKFVVIR